MPSNLIELDFLSKVSRGKIKNSHDLSGNWPWWQPTKKALSPEEGHWVTRTKLGPGRSPRHLKGGSTIQVLGPDLRTSFRQKRNSQALGRQRCTDKATKATPI